MSLDNWSPYAKIYDPLKVGSIDGTDSEPHDNGIVRAMNGSYKPRSYPSDSLKTLFVGRLDSSVTEEDVSNLFRKFGKLRTVRLVRDVITGLSKGYAFVEFKHSDEARKAKRETHRTFLKGKEMLVDFECGRTLPGWIPRRLGGGFGGRKESGQLRFGCIDRPWKRPIMLTKTRDGSSRCEKEDTNMRRGHGNSHKSSESSKREDRDSRVKLCASRYKT